MATNASTWFYAEPEHRAYFIEERLNHTFWSHRIGDLYLDCTHEEPPFRAEGEWNGLPVAIEWVPNTSLTLTTVPHDKIDLLIIGIKEILGFIPAVSYLDEDGRLVAEWHVQGSEQRLREIQANPKYRSVKRYTA
jgi:hypothetical protein